MVRAPHSILISERTMSAFTAAEGTASGKGKQRGLRHFLGIVIREEGNLNSWVASGRAV